MILLILLDGSPFLIIGNFIEGIIFIMIILPPTTRNVEGFNLYYFFSTSSNNDLRSSGLIYIVRFLFSSLGHMF